MYRPSRRQTSIILSVASLAFAAALIGREVMADWTVYGGSTIYGSSGGGGGGGTMDAGMIGQALLQDGSTESILGTNGIDGGCVGPYGQCTISPIYGSGPGTICQGNDPRLNPLDAGMIGQGLLTDGAINQILGTNGIDGGCLGPYQSCTLSPIYGSTAGTICQGNDSRLNPMDAGMVGQGLLADGSVNQILGTNGIDGGCVGPWQSCTLSPIYGTGAGQIAQGNDSRFLADANVATSNYGIGSIQPQDLLDASIGSGQLADGAVTPFNLQAALAGSDGSIASSNLGASAAGSLQAGPGITIDGGLGLPGTLTINVDQTFSPNWSGVHTFTSRVVYGSIAIPSAPDAGSTLLQFSNVVIAGQQVPYWQNGSRAFLPASVFCGFGAGMKFGFYPIRGNGAVSAAQVPTGMAFGGVTLWTVVSSACTFPAMANDGGPWGQVVPYMECSSSDAGNNQYADLFTGSSSSQGVGVLNLQSGLHWTVTFAFTTNQPGSGAFVGWGAVGGVNNITTREGIWLGFAPTTVSTTGNLQLITVVQGGGTNTSTDLGASFQRSVARIIQFTLDVPAVNSAPVAGYEVCDVTNPTAPPTCVRGTQSTNMAAVTTPLVMEIGNEANIALDGSANNFAQERIYAMEGCSGFTSVQ